MLVQLRQVLRAELDDLRRELTSAIKSALQSALVEWMEPLVSTSEAAPQISVSPATLRRWLREQREAGLVTAVTLAAVEYPTGDGTLLRWRVSTLKQWRRST